MADFTDKRFLITGGTSGFGLEAAKMIAAQGGHVAVTGMSEGHLEDARKALPDDALVLQNDASDPQAATELAKAVRNKFEKLDGLWLNAGYGKFGPNDENDAEFFDKMMNTNVRGPVLQMAELIDDISEGGAVLLTSSVAPYLGQAQGAVYAATKAACLALARSWSSALAERKIRVNSVAPGPIDTNFMEGMGLSDEEKDQFMEQIQNQVPLGRFGESREVAEVALFLLSDRASYVTGSEYFVDGGMTKR
ncbi:SDR family oxidoreductase [Qipengyuania sp. XHP0207]|uniref:SDR family oxidoreductase n=1 Tax=Qipengyuania sp. XHP0207 TaxID=3038078 RepID=UPI00241C1DDA|nr:SDR family oxidoreductase [Qipengyuania sp. XHP0207]MDG5748632.1 SDR family oxidoreductase [Qipengyuania sp. XHP0207]